MEKTLDIVKPDSHILKIADRYYLLASLGLQQLEVL